MSGATADELKKARAEGRREAVAGMRAAAEAIEYGLSLMVDAVELLSAEDFEDQRDKFALLLTKAKGEA